MAIPRISASSYSNTAPLVWSFLYGHNHGKVEIVLDNAPSRSAELLAKDRVDAALVPVIACQLIDRVKLIPDVCIGARRKVQSVCLVTKGEDLEHVRSVALDISSKSSVYLTKILFREFLGFEPVWKDAEPNLNAMLSGADCALIIGDPALSLSCANTRSMAATDSASFTYRTFDLAELWHSFTGLGFVFAMWMTRADASPIDFAAARDEGLQNIEKIVSNYDSEIDLDHETMRSYLTESISYSVDDSLRAGMELYFELAEKHGLIEKYRSMSFV